MDRRRFLELAGVLPLAAAAASCTRYEESSGRRAPTSGPTGGDLAESGPLYQVSLAEWSVNRSVQAKKLDHLDFPKYARSVGIDAVEYVSTLFADGKCDAKYVAALKSRCEGEGVQSLLIMVDGEGNLGAAEPAARAQAVANHHRWVEAAADLGCHAIRVNARSSGSYDEQADRAADGLRQLCDYGDRFGIDVIVENHGGLSSDGAWLAAVMRKTDHPRVGTLPDFGNFSISKTEVYDRYKGVEELMPFAKAVSGKSYAFDAKGRETKIDYARMMKIVVDAGYRGYVGIEFEGAGAAREGILATKALLESVRADLAKN
ncbi:MAG: sugar phosphate isomerase/epimerase family protein [Planctomycetota bacterium]